MPKLGLIVFILIPSLSHSAYYLKSSYPDFNPTYNSVGQTGLIHLPTASLQKVGSVGFSIGNSSLNKFISVTATPYPWLETSFFFHRPRQSFYIKKGKYLDKGFNIKIGANFRGVDLAIGVDDVGGTGLSSKEYIAATFAQDNLIMTFGIGTGAFAADHPYTNPISGNRQRPRRSIESVENRGGEVDFNRFFKGPIGLFGGIEYLSSRFPGLGIKIESNPFDYRGFLAGGTPTGKSIRIRKKEKDFNYGIYYKFTNNFVLSLSEIKGNSFDLSLTKRFNFNARPKALNPPQAKLISDARDNKLAFYINILRNLETDNLFLQSAELDKTELKLAIVNNKYNNPVDVFKHARIVTEDLSDMRDISISRLSITNVNSGMETGTIIGGAKNRLNPDEIGYVTIVKPSNNTKNYDFQTILSFPEFYNSIEPQFIYRYSDPTRFFAGGVDLQLNSEIKFASNFYLTTAISYQVHNSFKRLRYRPDSPYLPHVRTDVVKYLNNRPDLYLNSLQLDRFTKISNGHYLKYSAGMYEMMFGGYGIEYLWKPFRSNLSLGLSYYQVKQRNFEQRMSFSNYKVSTGHANLIYYLPATGLSIELSGGKYLAGDKGYTLDLSRQFKSGFKMGAYFTRTNISRLEYGEGSFDKGFYFDMPINIFGDDTEKGVTRLMIQPLTRDGGAKLKTNNELIYYIMSGAENDYLPYLD